MNNPHFHIVLEKTLSANDCGTTGGHQAGILIPKQDEFLNFFPYLAVDDINPRRALHFIDEEGRHWTFYYIYYNNKFRGGTRNEYRLTCMTAYIRDEMLEVGDKILISKQGDDYSIKFRRKKDIFVVNENTDEVVISLSGTWRIVNI